MKWHYCLVKKEDSYYIHEVYLDKFNFPNGITVNPIIDIAYESPEEAANDLMTMASDSMFHPVYNFNDFNSGFINKDNIGKTIFEFKKNKKSLNISLSISYFIRIIIWNLKNLLKGINYEKFKFFKTFLRNHKK